MQPNPPVLALSLSTIKTECQAALINSLAKKGFACCAAVRSTWPQSNAFVCKLAASATTKTTTTRTTHGNGLHSPSHVSELLLLHAWALALWVMWPKAFWPYLFMLLLLPVFAAHLRVLFAYHFWATNRFRRLTVGVICCWSLWLRLQKLA